MSTEAIKNLLRPDHSNGRVRLLIVIAMVLGTIRLIESPPLQSANDRSRWATAWSLVERNTYQIDEIRRYRGWDTIDKVKIDDHFYSSKPPLFATIVAGGYWGIKHTLGWTIDPNRLETVTPVSQLLLFLINVVPAALALGSLARILAKHAEISFTRNFVLAAACFGTLWSAFLPSLNNHTPAICCVIFALRAAIISLPSSLTVKRLAFAGFMSGLAVTFELPALAFLGLLFAILLKYQPKRTLVGFLPMALIPLAAFLITNKVAIGSWAPAYATHGQAVSPYNYVENGIPSYWMEPKGLDKNADQFYAYLFHCTLGHHGLFSLTPILLLSLAGLFRFRKWQFSSLAPFYLLGALLTVIVLSFYLMQTKSWNYGGVSVGLRWMMWLIPFWLLMMIPAVDLISVNRIGQAFLLLLLAPSVFSAWFPFDAPWKQPWLYNVMARAGKLGQYDEPPLKYEFPHRSWLAELPAGEAVDPHYWVELSGTGVDGTAITLRIADAGPATVEGRRGRRVEFVWNGGRATESSRTLTIDAGAFLEGEDFGLLLWPEGALSQNEVLTAFELLCGVPVGVDPATGKPLPPSYSLAARRYQFLGVRNDAFRCEIGVGWGLRQTTAPGIATVSIRSEAWNTPELPFGVGQWEQQTRHGESGALLAVRRLSVVRAGKFLQRPTPPAG